MRFFLYMEKDEQTGERSMIMKNDGMQVPELLLVLETLAERGRSTFSSSVQGNVASS